MPQPTIIIDTREQRPFLFTKYPCAIKRVGLKQGDYSVEGLEDRIAIERKSLSDLVGTLTQGRDRFYRELDRLKDYDFVAIVIEATYRQVAHGPYAFSRAKPYSIIRTLHSIQQKRGVQVIFAGDAAHAEEWTFNALEMFWKTDRAAKILAPEDGSDQA